ncbi:hypothetical protein PG994_013834 [Apiospora phragmitis]|uniref:Uncharacterized protein n=1 Tax=Apiospora phragmitis TaxID=2905665 RepID=A0ABR1T2L5_9PEZI
MITKLDYSTKVPGDETKGFIRKPVLNPTLAKAWEREVISLDRAAGRGAYWKRFRWTSRFKRRIKAVLDELPDDPTVPQDFKNRGPLPSKVSNQGDYGFASVDPLSIPLMYNQKWVLFENAPRDPPETNPFFKLVNGWEESKESQTSDQEERDQVMGLDKNRRATRQPRQQEAAMSASNPDEMGADDIKEEYGSPQAVDVTALHSLVETSSIKSEPKSP